jgi:transcriptional regulator with XRE-family HTH domain
MTALDGSGDARARELADLLRSRRERLRPSDVGLPAGSRRRTRGLRREEVAQLAAISPAYYAVLERGRDVQPSPQVLDALARALLLTPAERVHLHELADREALSAQATPEALSPGVADLVDRLDPDPAYVSGRCWNVLAANRAARALWTDWPALAPADRNMLLWTFTCSRAREVFVEWESEARTLLGRFRAAAARHPGDPEFERLIERLHDDSPEARNWWAAHDVAPLSSGVKRLRHAELGELRLRHVVLLVADDPEQKLVTFSASGDDRRRIAALIGRAAQRSPEATK